MQQDKSSYTAERAIVRPVNVTPVNLIFITIVVPEFVVRSVTLFVL